MRVQAYLFFDGRCDEAIAFYEKALGAEVIMRSRFKDAPPGAGVGPEQDGEKVMHVSFRIGETTVFASDGRCGGQAEFKGFSLSLTVPTPAESERLFAALADGGRVVMPLTKTFYSPSFGMVTDRFGVGWMLMTGE